MSITIKVEGLEQLRAALSNLDKSFDEAIDEAFEEGAIWTHAEVVRGIQRGPASGRVYELYNPRRTHQASAPGEAPMSDMGTLARSVFMDIGRGEATVGSRLAYAAYLEYGTSRMAPRPIWTPTSERLREKLPEFINASLARALK